DGNGHKKYRMQHDSRLSELSEPSELQLKAVEITVSSPKKLSAKAREDFNVGTSKIDTTKKSHRLNPLPMDNINTTNKHCESTIEEQGYKQRSDVDINDIAKLPRLNEKDAIILNKAMQYSQKAFDEALATKETVLRIEAIINEFIKEQKASKDLDMESNECSMDYKKMSDKNPTDDIMCDTIYNALVEEHPDEITKIECAKGGWS
ncbi:15785_t:CDS:2, partial [Funneliformis caledonium]